MPQVGLKNASEPVEHSCNRHQRLDLGVVGQLTGAQPDHGWPRIHQASGENRSDVGRQNLAVGPEANQPVCIQALCSLQKCLQVFGGFAIGEKKFIFHSRYLN